MTALAAIHPYEMIPLDIAGYILGAALLLGHITALFKREEVSMFLQRSSRNILLGQVTLGIAFTWFFLLVAPGNLGFLSRLSIELAEFEKMKWILQLLCPVFLFLMTVHTKELLFPRALGFLCLLVASPFMTAAFLKDPESRILIPVWGYTIVILGLFWVGKPYLYRDMVNWATARASRWNLLCLGGAFYGVAILACAFLWW